MNSKISARRIFERKKAPFRQNLLQRNYWTYERKWIQSKIKTTSIRRGK